MILLVYDTAGTYEDNGVTYWLGEIDNYAQHDNIIVIGNKTDLLKERKKKLTNDGEFEKPALL